MSLHETTHPAGMRSGAISRPDFHRLMEKHLLMYWMYQWNGPWQRLSLVDAGGNKSDYNAALYDGGWLVAFCLDVLIRETTDGGHRLDDLMRLMDERFGETSVPYSNEDIVDIATDLGGLEVVRFFEDHVAGTRRIPMREWLKRSGCNATVSGRAMIVHDTQVPDSIFEQSSRAIESGPSWFVHRRNVRRGLRSPSPMELAPLGRFDCGGPVACPSAG